MSKPFSIKILMDAVKELTLNPINSDTGHPNNTPAKLQ
jgi:hypothetical protein